jgi:hypothetical protein
METIRLIQILMSESRLVLSNQLNWQKSNNTFFEKGKLPL